MILRPSPATGLHKGVRRKPLTREEAEALALAALNFLSGDEDRIARFLALSGLDPGTLRKAASEPSFLPAIIDYLAGDEALLLAFAEEARIPPERIGAARHLLTRLPDFS